ncbi:hypothetical protein L2106_24380 [Citrobacter portucalensis]|uniref:hypothetical protein n=1 Tax=Citrobacter portucalensis TaxID=1639133 RepID=UPI0023B2BAD9|nr:hypothetical protein [Citrobacter portucalensis]MDE9576524.1 hypothetical protein [Citrobacter portucalensis]MEB2744153.1 hypothetical protein [Citrobacter portucalensis]
MQRYHTLICKPGTHVKDCRSRARGSLSGKGILVMFFDHAHVSLHDGVEHPGDPMSELADRCSAFIIEEGYPWS